MAGSIVLLTGPVGAGKTTVAQELIAGGDGGLVSIEGDVFWSFIKRPQPGAERNKAFTMIMRAMLASARHYERDGYEVIVDFTIPPWYLDAVRALLTGKPFNYVVLRPSEAVCAARAAERAEGTIADYGPYRELYAAFDGYEQMTIVNDAASPSDVAEFIRAGLAAGTFRMT